jgi:transposase
VELFGVGPVVAATFLGKVGDIGRFPTKHHYAAHTGTAPPEASSGQVIRHRLSRAGDRKLNHALYRSQGREGQAERGEFNEAPPF